MDGAEGPGPSGKVIRVTYTTRRDSRRPYHVSSDKEARSESPLVDRRSIALQQLVVSMEPAACDRERNSLGHNLAGEDRLNFLRR
jgi:hypothetical protein